MYSGRLSKKDNKRERAEIIIIEIISLKIIISVIAEVIFEIQHNDVK